MVRLMVHEFRAGRWLWRNNLVNMRLLTGMVISAEAQLVNMSEGCLEESGKKRQTQHGCVDRLHRNTSLRDGAGSVKPLPCHYLSGVSMSEALR
jgi:hypothetical protein